MEQFPANSHASRITRENRGESPSPKDEKVEKIVAGAVTRRKKTLGKRFSETFLGGDAKSALSYAVFEVLAPAAKDMAVDVATKWFERLIFGEGGTKHRPSSRSTSFGGYTSYNRYSQASRREEPRGMSRRGRESHDLDEILLDTRAEADAVIDQLFYRIEKYGSTTLSDLYNLVGVASSYTDEKWGWTDIRGAEPKRTRSGYVLDLPRPEPLD